MYLGLKKKKKWTICENSSKITKYENYNDQNHDKMFRFSVVLL